jgi:peroxiredoxin
MDREAVAANLTAAFVAARESDAPLNERLASYTRALEHNLPDYAQCVERLIARLTAASTGAKAPKVGDPLPEFLLPDSTGRLVSLSGILSDGPAAIVLLRGHWCPYCRLTAHALARIADSRAGTRRSVFALTPERQTFTQKLTLETRAAFPILTDSENGYSLSINLAVWLGDELSGMLASLGRDLAAYQGNQSWFVPIPATFVVSSKGIITARFIDPDYRRRFDSEALAKALASAS